MTLPPLQRCRFAAVLVLAFAPALQAQGRLRFDTTATTASYSPVAGLQLKSPDGHAYLRLRAWMQTDYRNSLDGGTDAPPPGFSLRRTRVVFDAQPMPGVAIRISPDFGGSRVSIDDAFADFGLGHAVWLRAGRQRVPFGIERERGITEQYLPERSLGSQLTANRDVGLVLNGEWHEGRFGFAAGIQNGVPDGLAGTGDVNAAKDVVIRLSGMPYQHTVHGVVQGLRLAIGALTGIEAGDLENTQLPTYSTASGVPFFTYLPGDSISGAGATIAAGRRTRLGAAIVWHGGPAGLLAEVVQTRQTVQHDAATAALRQRGWGATGMWSLTGEPSAPNGLTPAHAFDPSHHAFGALQAVVRLSRLRVDDATFPTFADAALSARRATAWGVGINWFWTRLTKVQVAYESTSFAGGAAVGDRPADHSVWVRTQLTL